MTYVKKCCGNCEYFSDINGGGTLYINGSGTLYQGSCIEADRIPGTLQVLKSFGFGCTNFRVRGPDEGLVRVYV